MNRHSARHRASAGPTSRHNQDAKADHQRASGRQHRRGRRQKQPLLPESEEARSGQRTGVESIGPAQLRVQGKADSPPTHGRQMHQPHSSPRPLLSAWEPPVAQADDRPSPCARFRSRSQLFEQPRPSRRCEGQEPPLRPISRASQSARERVASWAASADLRPSSESSGSASCRSDPLAQEQGHRHHRVPNRLCDQARVRLCAFLPSPNGIRGSSKQGWAEPRFRKRRSPSRASRSQTTAGKKEAGGRSQLGW